MAKEATRATLVGLLVLAKRPLTTPHIVALARPLRLSATNVRSHLTRLTAEGVLSRVGARRSQTYTLSADRARIAARIAASLAAQPEDAWSGDWLLVAVRLPRERARRERLQQALWFDGFRPCAPATYLRPDWPRPWAVDRARALAPSALCFVGTLTGTMTLAQVRKMYALDALERQARRLAAAIDRHSRALRDPAAAFRARLEVGGLVARLVAHDPRLPPAIWGRRHGLQELRAAFRRFEARIGPLAERFVDSVTTSSGYGTARAS
jgi:DNA-binding transcriptional regulator PaaX